MYTGQHQLVGNGNQDAAAVFAQQQQQQQQQLAQQHYYTAIGGNGGGAAYFPAQPFQSPQRRPTSAAPTYPNNYAPHPQQHPQQQQQQQQQQQPQEYPREVVHGDPNSMSAPMMEDEISKTPVALSLFDLPPPLAVGSLPPFATPEMGELAQLMAVALQHRCEAMRAFERVHQSTFHSKRIPDISIWDYLRRIAKYSGCSPECFVVGLIVIDRYSAATGIPVTFRNIHRLSITAVMVSAKLRDDIYYSNAYYASIGGVTCRELSQLELRLLSTISWATWVDATLFNEYVRRLWEYYRRFLPPAQQG